MQTCLSRYFGRLQWGAEDELVFPCGLPGFEHERRFIAVQPPGLRPLVFLQSADDPGVCFLTVPVRVAEPAYEPAIQPDDLRLLGFSEDRQPALGADVLCLAIVSLQENAPPTANLLAPVVVNLHTRVAVQAIRGDIAYSHRQTFCAGR